MRALLRAAAALIRQAQDVAENIGYADHGTEDVPRWLDEARATCIEAAEDAENVVWRATDGR